MVFTPAITAPRVLSERSRWFLVRQSALVVRVHGAGVDLPGLGDVLGLGLDREQAHYLGRADDEDCFALDASGFAGGEPWAVEGLRSLHGRLDDESFAIAGRAVQIATFGATHRYCGSCGQPTERDPVERCVRCVACALSCYPRVSPAIIVLVRRGDQALLARSARFATGMYSTLAGFVEAGESLEETLVREVREEVGIEVGNARYFGSQPWPFPHSLMVGFFADHVSGDIAVDGVEIVEAAWFSADALPAIPPRLSIARRLIDAWVAEVQAQVQGVAQVQGAAQGQGRR